MNPFSAGRVSFKRRGRFGSRPALCAGFLVASSAFLFPVGAQQRDLAALTDTVFARWNSTHTPGCAVGIARDGKTLLTRGYGMADLETGAPITAETIFESGSVAKQFTATAVLLLAMDGKLDLADPVRKHLPEFPQYDRPITIRHLLTHTSGLRDWSNLVAVGGWPRGEKAHTQLDLLDIVYRQRALNYPVGDHYSYTNSGYAVAMSLVERVSGKTFQEFTRERIFAPLGMRHTHWRDDFTRIVPGRAQAYGFERGEWHLNMPFESVVGPGGMLTTVGDWLIWNEALATSALRPGHTDSLTRQMRLTSGRVISYALGVTVGQYRGVRQVAHSGSTGGYSTYLARYPDRGNLSIAVLCNSAQGNATQYTRQLVDRLITDFPVPARPDTIALDREAWAMGAGIYYNSRTHATLELPASLVPNTQTRSMAGGWFRQVNDSRIYFEFGPNGKPVAMRLTGADNDTTRYIWVAEQRWKPAPQQLKAFEGSYRADEIGVTYQVKVVGDSLAWSVRPGVWTTLQPVYPDAFQRGGTAVWFTRERARITALHIGQARMWDLVVPRIP